MILKERHLKNFKYGHFEISSAVILLSKDNIYLFKLYYNAELFKTFIFKSKNYIIAKKELKDHFKKLVK